VRADYSLTDGPLTKERKRHAAVPFARGEKINPQKTCGPDVKLLGLDGKGGRNTRILTGPGEFSSSEGCSQLRLTCLINRPATKGGFARIEELNGKLRPGKEKTQTVNAKWRERKDPSF